MAGTARNTRQASEKSRAAFLFLALFSLTVCLCNLGGRSFENKEYRRYAEVAWEIVATGDWLLLRHEGKIYPDKPPLHFWKIALCYKLFGVGPFSARLPAALFAVTGVLAAAFAAFRFLRSVEAGVLAGLLLLGSYGYFWWARRTRIDMEFSVLFSVAMLCAYQGVHLTRAAKKAAAYSAYWFITGLAFLDKGPIALTTLCPIVVYMLVLRVRRKQGNTAGGLFALTSPWFLLPTGAWWLALNSHSRFEAYWAAFQARKIMQRSEGPLYYLVEFPAKLFPASCLLVLGAVTVRWKRLTRQERDSVLFPLLWLVVYLVLLHTTRVKNHRYLLPVFIPACVCAAWSLKRCGELCPAGTARFTAVCDRLLLAVTGGAFAVPFAMAAYCRSSVAPLLPPVVVLGAVLLLGRRFVPYRSARWCVSVAVLLCLIDAADTARNERTSPVLRMYRQLEREGVPRQGICFCRGAEKAKSLFELYSGTRYAMGFTLTEVLKDPALCVAIAPAGGENLAPAPAGVGRQVRFEDYVALWKAPSGRESQPGGGRLPQK